MSDLAPSVPFIAVSVYDGRADNRPQEEAWVLSTLRTKLESARVRGKKDGPLWSPASFGETKHRKDEYVEALSCLVLDFDDGPHWNDFVGEWEAWTYAIHTTFQHRPEAPRWRAVFPLAQPVTADCWHDVYASLAIGLGKGQTDPSCSDRSRMYYLPSHPAGAEFYSHWHDGDLLRPDAFPLVEMNPPEPMPKPSQPGNGARPGDDYDVRTSWDDILIPWGWTMVRRWGMMTLWTRPGKKPRDGVSARTGPGTFGDRFYCWSSNAGVPVRKLRSKFQLLADVEYGGDYSTCAKELAKKGFGTPAKLPDPPPPGKRLIDTIPTDGLPQIETNGRQLREITHDALACIIASNNPPWVFVRGGELVTVIQDEFENSRIRTAKGEVRAGILARVADWVSTSSKRGAVAVAPPKNVVDDLTSLVPWNGIPGLIMVSPCPVVGRDGTIQRSRGYHPSTLTYVAGGDDWPRFTEGGEAAAKWLCDELIPDFPFVDQASRANALGLIVTPFVRALVKGTAPFHLFDAPTSSTGKTLLAQTCLVPGFGWLEVKAPPTREEDWNKVLTTVFAAGLPALIIDNLANKVDSPAFMAAVTSSVWGDRKFNDNTEYMQLPNRCVFVGTSNNAQLAEDFLSRTVFIRLDSGLERPSERQRFKHPQEDWCRTDRPIIGAAALAMVEAWVDKGMPKGGARHSRFPSWSGIVSGILETCGVEGFLGNMDQLIEANDDEHIIWSQFLADWLNAFGEDEVSVQDVYRQFSGGDTLQAIVGGEGDDEKKRHRLGKKLAYRKDKVFGDVRLRLGGKGKTGRRFKTLRNRDVSDNNSFLGVNARPVSGDLFTENGEYTHAYSTQTGSIGDIVTSQVQNAGDDSSLSSPDDDEGEDEVLI
jgi:hypothetical protein